MRSSIVSAPIMLLTCRIFVVKRWKKWNAKTALAGEPNTRGQFGSCWVGCYPCPTRDKASSVAIVFCVPWQSGTRIMRIELSFPLKSKYSSDLFSTSLLQYSRKPRTSVLSSVSPCDSLLYLGHPCEGSVWTSWRLASDAPAQVIKRRSWR